MRINNLVFDYELRAAGLIALPFDWSPNGLGDLSQLDADTQAQVEAVFAAHDPTRSLPEPVPDNPTLGDWRVGLALWRRLEDVTSRVDALLKSDKPTEVVLGTIASERLNYSNNVLRAQLMQLKDVFGFTADEVDESLWRAERVRLGDLSGVWPLTA